MSSSSSSLSSRFVALLLVGAAVCGMGGCLDGGSDEQPGGIVQDLTDRPDRVWRGMQQALDSRDANGWIDSVAMTFEYVPDAVSEAAHPGIWSPWGRAEEMAFARALFAADLELHAQLNVNGAVCPAPLGTTVMWPAVEYSVVVSGAGGDSPVTYRGVADLEFRLEGSFWYLSRWVDLRGAPAPWNGNVVCPTLGELRAAYRGR